MNEQNRICRKKKIIHVHVKRKTDLLPFLKVPMAANKKEFVYKTKVNPIHTILKCGDYHDFMDR